MTDEQFFCKKPELLQQTSSREEEDSLSDPAVRIVVGGENATEMVATFTDIPGYGTVFTAVCVASVDELNALLAAEFGVRIVVIEYFFLKNMPTEFDFSKNPPERLPGRLTHLLKNGSREVVGVSTMEPYLADMTRDGCSRVCKPTELPSIIRGLVA